MNKLYGYLILAFVFILFILAFIYMAGRIDDLKSEVKLKDNIIAFEIKQKEQIYKDLEVYLNEQITNKTSYETYNNKKMELKKNDEIKNVLDMPLSFDVVGLLQ